MAKKKKKSKAKKRPSHEAAQTADETLARDAEGSGEEEEEEEEDHEDDADEPEPEPAAAAKPARTEKPTVNLRGRARHAPEVDPLIPSPDGPRVSNKGGLIFVLVVLALMGLAIAAQFAMG